MGPFLMKWRNVEIMVERFNGQAACRIGSKAKAMIVTRSRLHAVRCKLALDAFLKEKGNPYLSLLRNRFYRFRKSLQPTERAEDAGKSDGV